MCFGVCACTRACTVEMHLVSCCAEIYHPFTVNSTALGIQPYFAFTFQFRLIYDQSNYQNSIRWNNVMSSDAIKLKTTNHGCDVNYYVISWNTTKFYLHISLSSQCVTFNMSRGTVVTKIQQLYIQYSSAPR